MLNSQLLSDFIQGIAWTMVRQNWKQLGFWIWETAIPGALAITTFFVVFFNVAGHVDYGTWYIGVPLLLGCVLSASFVVLLVGTVQSAILRLIGKPNYFDSWDVPIEIASERPNSSVDPTEF